MRLLFSSFIMCLGLCCAHASVAFAAKDGNGSSMEISEVTWASSLLIA